ncbi:LysR family transcriptional regulator [Acidiferrimicrobium sp. IK]|uniref:LysR family transcriptional regulator n=1 Tax=Acidiferrimicrobium sp. IK TaxID=2871700 RepID=UPI0021CB50CF|nr:LysR family transcriptional regulator [Acidiferrimicrobium sp. IK]MCU4186630.1 LysR family transcriptional regulator [Acidiferrimicrobium sp. IK]
MDLRQLSTFVAVAEEASFSRAAERLHVAQSAVSATIRNLEREWGIQLFRRTTHSVALSDAGRTLLDEARAALRAGAAVEHAVDEVRGGLRGTLRVGIMQTTQPSALSVAAAISAFRAEHPGVTVAVRQSPSADMAAAVRSGELDLAFVGLPDRHLPGLDLTTLIEGELHLACAAAHRLAGRRDIELAALTGEPFAELPAAWGIRLATDRAFAAAGVQRTIAYEINDVATVGDFVRHGIAVAITSPIFVTLDPDIALVAIRHHAPRFAVSLAMPATRRSGPAARAFAAAAQRTAVGV